jgi:hypothetical protein
VKHVWAWCWVLLGAACQREPPSRPALSTSPLHVQPAAPSASTGAGASGSPSAQVVPAHRCGTSDVPWVWSAGMYAHRGNGGTDSTSLPRATVGTTVPWPVESGQSVTIAADPWKLAPEDLVVSTVKPQAPRAGERPLWDVTIDAHASSLQTLADNSTHVWSTPGIVVCPATPIRILSAASVGADMPNAPGASPNTLWVAVDTTLDGKPDVEIFWFYCGRPHVSVNEKAAFPAELGCRTLYQRTADGEWKLLDDERDD